MRKYGSQSEVADAWAKGLDGPVEASNMRMGSQRPSWGTLRDTDQIFSYGWWSMGVRIDSAKTFVLNGDRYSNSTSQQQSYVRGAAAGREEYQTILIPFSALELANVDPKTVRIIETKPDFEEYRCNDCASTYPDYDLGSIRQHKLLSGLNGKEHSVSLFHQLGGSVFRSGRRYFLSGFDDTHSARTDGYFLSELPRPCRTVEAAFASLAPKAVVKAVGLDVKRQGDIFGIPSRMTTRKLKAPIHRMARLLGTNHLVTESAVAKNGTVYGRGVLHHKPRGRVADHRQIKLGKVWHVIVRNRAKGSWSGSGRVD